MQMIHIPLLPISQKTSGDNAYGSFSLTNGTWTYTLDNANSTADALDDGDTITDTYTFSATDGTNQTITVTINGADDASVVSGTLTGSVTENSVTPQPQRVRLPSLMSMQTIHSAFADLCRNHWR